MNIKTFIFNPFQENTYLLYDEERNALIIDAGMFFAHEKQEIQFFIEQHRLKLKRIINTHLHLDHQFGNRFLFETYGIAPEAAKEDEFFIDKLQQSVQRFGINYQEHEQALAGYLKDGDRIDVGSILLKSMAVPGHSPGSLAFYCEDEKTVFVGDVLFQGSIGRTDLEQGNYNTLMNSIQTKLLTLPDETIVYSGHGITTTIGTEKQVNPYLI